VLSRAFRRAGCVAPAAGLLIGVCVAWPGANMATASSSSTVYFPQSQEASNPAYKPSTLQVAGDGSFIVVNTHWRFWSTTSASGFGTGVHGYAGRTHYRDPIEITLTRPRRLCGNEVWTRGAFYFPHGVPAELRRRSTWTLGVFPCAAAASSFTVVCQSLASLIPCFRFVAHPTTMGLGSGGRTTLISLRWQNWGHASASARGRERENGAAAGAPPIYTYTPATVTATHLTSCDGHHAYTTIRIAAESLTSTYRGCVPHESFSQ
jgi:hypothetical protein